MTTTFAFALVLAMGPSSPEQLYPLPAPIAEVLSEEVQFARFAAPLAQAGDTTLGEPANDGPRARLLLAIRVHLAMLDRDEPVARRTAARIRENQTNAAARAYAGLTTMAFFEACNADGKVDPERFLEEFRALLRTLPRDEPTREVLRQQRERLADLTDAALAAEREGLVRDIGKRREVTLAEADRLVRWRHRLVNLAPLRDVLARAFDEAWEERAP